MSIKRTRIARIALTATLGLAALGGVAHAAPKGSSSAQMTQAEIDTFRETCETLGGTFSTSADGTVNCDYPNGNWIFCFISTGECAATEPDNDGKGLSGDADSDSILEILEGPSSKESADLTGAIDTGDGRDTSPEPGQEEEPDPTDPPATDPIDKITAPPVDGVVDPTPDTPSAPAEPVVPIEREPGLRYPEVVDPPAKHHPADTTTPGPVRPILEAQPVIAQ